MAENGRLHQGREPKGGDDLQITRIAAQCGHEVESLDWDGRREIRNSPLARVCHHLVAAWDCSVDDAKSTVTGARSKSLAAMSVCAFMPASLATNLSGTISSRVS